MNILNNIIEIGNKQQLNSFKIIIGLNKYVEHSEFVELPTTIKLEFTTKSIKAIDGIGKTLLEWELAKKITETHLKKIANLILNISTKTHYVDDDKNKKITSAMIFKIIVNTTLFQDLKTARKEFDESLSQKFEVTKSVGMNNQPYLKIDNYVDNVTLLWKDNPFFYDEAKIYWFWDKEKTCYQMADEVAVMILIDKELNFGGQVVNHSLRSNYLYAFQHVGRTKKPKSFPTHWIQFKDKIVNLQTKEVFKATPEFFSCNPINWEIGENIYTPEMDKLFIEWVGEKKAQVLYEILAYCCLPDYPIHNIFCLFGGGSNGKSVFQRLLMKFIGLENTCSSELDQLIDNRFETAKLYKKLVCVLGETNFGVMQKSSMLKKLSGQDLVSFEFKNKNPIDDMNYATIMINSNSLPTSYDQSDGFYRRWVIINFPHTFPRGSDPLKRIPDYEFNNLALKVSKLLPVILTRGYMTGTGEISDQKDAYIKASNPLPFFLKDDCTLGSNLVTKYKDIYEAYCKYLKVNKNRKVTRKEFKQAMEEEGLFVERTSRYGMSTFWVDGVMLKHNSPDYEALRDKLKMEKE